MNIHHVHLIHVKTRGGVVVERTEEMGRKVMCLAGVKKKKLGRLEKNREEYKGRLEKVLVPSSFLCTIPSWLFKTPLQHKPPAASTLHQKRVQLTDQLYVHLSGPHTLDEYSSSSPETGRPDRQALFLP